MRIFWVLLVSFNLLQPAIAQPAPRGHRACIAAIDRAIDRSNVPWYLTGRVRRDLLRDVRAIKRGSLTVDAAVDRVLDALRDRGIEPGWARSLSRQYRRALIELLQQQPRALPER